MTDFVDRGSIVRRIWADGDMVLLIFAGSAAEFALNRAVDSPIGVRRRQLRDVQAQAYPVEHVVQFVLLVRAKRAGEQFSRSL